MSTITPAITYPIQSGTAHATTPPASGTFIPVIWSGKLNAKFYDVSTFSAVCNTDWEGEIKSYGDKVIIRDTPTVVIQDYKIGVPLDYKSPAMTTQELVIDQGKYFAFPINDVLKAQSDIAMMEKFTASAGEEMRVAMDSTNWYHTFSGAHASNKGASAGKNSGAYDLGTDSAPVALTRDNVVEKILQLAGVLDEQNVPNEDRWLVIDPVTRQLLFQSDLAKSYITGDNSSPLRNGLIGAIDRFKVYVSNLLPRATGEPWLSGNGQENSITASSGVKRRAIIAGHKSAMTFASQFAHTETLRNPNDFGDLVRGVKVFGRKVVKPEAMAVLVAA